MPLDLSPTMRDYLAEIYRLSDREGIITEAARSADSDVVTTSALAEILDVSAPAVNRMITKLRELGLIDHEPYHGISLTPTGKYEALKELRRHRIAEAFLVKVLGFGWHEVHTEANRIASTLSDKLTERMAEMAGHPAHCPHGEPIPSPGGDLPDMNDCLLIDARQDTELEITRVRTREPNRLEYLAALGLIPGVHIRILHVAPFNGPMQLKVGKEYRIIGHNLAELIRVRPSG